MSVPEYAIERLVIPATLDFTTRAELTTAASVLIEHAHAEVEVDCSAITDVDDPTVWLTRTAKRRGIAIVLDKPPPSLLRALELAGVADRFAVRDT
jgi:ABC-type transporter Mla MlaB component